MQTKTLGDLGHVRFHAGVHDTPANIRSEDMGMTALTQIVVDPQLHGGALDGEIIEATLAAIIQPNDASLGNDSKRLVRNTLSERSQFIAEGFIHASSDGALFFHVDFVGHESEEVLMREMNEVGTAQVESGAQAGAIAVTADFRLCQIILLMMMRRKRSGR